MRANALEAFPEGLGGTAWGLFGDPGSLQKTLRPLVPPAGRRQRNTMVWWPLVPAALKLHVNYWNLKLTTGMSNSVDIVSNLTAARQISLDLSNRFEYRSQPPREA